MRCSQVPFENAKRVRNSALWNPLAGIFLEKIQRGVDALRECGAAVRFVSFEPLLEDLGPISLYGIDWAIVGGESGPGYRPMDHAWARSIRDQCVAAGVPFFFKQSAAFRTETGPDLQEEDGTFTTWQQYPPDPRELPEEPGVSGDPEQREQIPLTLC